MKRFGFLVANSVPGAARGRVTEKGVIPVLGGITSFLLMTVTDFRGFTISKHRCLMVAHMFLSVAVRHVVRGQMQSFQSPDILCLSLWFYQTSSKCLFKTKNGFVLPIDQSHACNATAGSQCRLANYRAARRLKMPNPSVKEFRQPGRSQIGILLDLCLTSYCTLSTNAAWIPLCNSSMEVICVPGESGGAGKHFNSPPNDSPRWLLPLFFARLFFVRLFEQFQVILHLQTS